MLNKTGNRIVAVEFQKVNIYKNLKNDGSKELYEEDERAQDENNPVRIARKRFEDMLKKAKQNYQNSVRFQLDEDLGYLASDKDYEEFISITMRSARFETNNSLNEAINNAPGDKLGQMTVDGEIGNNPDDKILTIDEYFTELIDKYG